MEEKVLAKSKNSYKRKLLIAIAISALLLVICVIMAAFVSDIMVEKIEAAAAEVGLEPWTITFNSSEWYPKWSFWWDMPEYSTFAGLAFAAIIVILGILLWYLSSTEMIITDKRVYGKAAFGRRVDLPLDSISAIGTMWFGGLSVASSSGKIAFVGLSNRNELQAAISGLLVNRQSKPAATTTIKQEIPQSNADELKKYKDLLDSGVISQEEFDAKKKQLLGL